MRTGSSPEEEEKMRWRIFLICGISMFLSTVVIAQSKTTAVYLAEQGGIIAGAAQACGEDVGEFSKRLGAEIDKHALNDDDRVNAVRAYADAMRDFNWTMLNTPPLSCAEIIRVFHRQPIMQK